MVIFFVKSNENTYSKGRALMQMYRVVPITKRGNSYFKIFTLALKTFIYWCDFNHLQLLMFSFC